jgi:phosphoribosylaminoimidazolecarboxamide formyltransferase/IMP cyclohydrolase
MAAHGIEPIDLLIVNLYPFEETVAKGADHATCIENIDIGGPAMIRAAAKNHASSPWSPTRRIMRLLDQLKAHDGATSLAFRKKLALTAYSRTAAYDTAVSTWLAGEIGRPAPRYRSFAGKLAQTLRYGENPHQAAAFYTDGSRRPGVATARQWQGKELSYNNINDTDAAFELVAEFAPPRPGLRDHQARQPLRRGARREPDLTPTCAPMTATRPGLRRDRRAEPAAGRGHRRGNRQDLHRSRHRPRRQRRGARGLCGEEEPAALLTTGGCPTRKAGAGLPSGRGRLSGAGPRCRAASRRRSEGGDETRAHRPGEMADLMFAWKVAKHVKSNAIVYVKDGATVGVGAGQMSRVDSAPASPPARPRTWPRRWACRKAADQVGSVVASDAFFPFADGLLTAAEAGATAVIQPGGMRERRGVIAAADEGRAGHGLHRPAPFPALTCDARASGLAALVTFAHRPG